MSEGESFLARWSRLKREQAATPSRKEDAQAPEHVPAPVEAPPPAVDVGKLPPIESIGPGSDISAFLTVGVPLALTQAALRSAWRTDPAVRDFVEIADNQWDFNTPDAIPGFGALGATEEAKALVARATTGMVENTAATLASLKTGSGRPDSQLATGTSLAESRVVDPVWQAGTIPAGEVEQASTDMAAKRLEPDAPAPGRRLHGSALPK